jgi:hypothetical protein
LSFVEIRELVGSEYTSEQKAKLNELCVDELIADNEKKMLRESELVNPAEIPNS